MGTWNSWNRPGVAVAGVPTCGIHLCLGALVAGMCNARAAAQVSEIALNSRDPCPRWLQVLKDEKHGT